MTPSNAALQDLVSHLGITSIGRASIVGVLRGVEVVGHFGIQLIRGLLRWARALGLSTTALLGGASSGLSCRSAVLAVLGTSLGRSSRSRSVGDARA